MRPRLGPLSVEQKKRGPIKRARLEKNQEDERRPQEIKEEDISRSLNETTKNVAVVSSVSVIVRTHFEPIRLKGCWRSTESLSIFLGSSLIPMTLRNRWRIYSISLSSFAMEKSPLKLINRGSQKFVSGGASNKDCQLTKREDFCEQPSPEDYEGGLQKRQIVMEFDMSVWKVRINFFIV